MHTHARTRATRTHFCTCTHTPSQSVSLQNPGSYGPFRPPPALLFLSSLLLSPSCPLTDDFFRIHGFHHGTRGASMPLTQAGTGATVCGVFARSPRGLSFASQPTTLIHRRGSGVSEQVTAGAWGPGVRVAPPRVFLPPRWWFSPFTVDQSQLRGAPCDARSPLAAPARTLTPEICGSEACVHMRSECPRGSDAAPAVCLSPSPAFLGPPAPCFLSARLEAPGVAADGHTWLVARTLQGKPLVRTPKFAY